MKKNGLFALAITVILSTAFIIYMRNTETPVYKPGIWPDADAAVNQAKYLYEQKKKEGVDISSGPCLSNSVYANWVADLVHNPRQPVDDLSQNQCSSYREGTAKHFVELDLEGNLVRVK